MSEFSGVPSTLRRAQKWTERGSFPLQAIVPATPVYILLPGIGAVVEFNRLGTVNQVVPSLMV
jgi:hypothetical protein